MFSLQTFCVKRKVEKIYTYNTGLTRLYKIRYHPHYFVRYLFPYPKSAAEKILFLPMYFSTFTCFFPAVYQTSLITVFSSLKRLA